MPLINTTYKVIPTLNEQVPWIDKNQNSKMEKDEIAPAAPLLDIYRD